ncbi:bifunctional YncE family protein/alkaline phosphatase family protein [Actinacidiphila acididurans]|uniref:Bifunctional YncE family protein/alkaline phosphatase family protein n=1 Tax=Actinacidiphila acididurans TaxID=2784346 RepID=A0ABS2U2Y5_9ACTN|nr:bifunctional YncE family protein/alkaline phosphatase family protein [Actinacidiphila acididurans]MBM9509727.1 bifunctional YncE family protein/alkaline phosphatase family protein [Actinacidiphila acididurans]
MHVARRRRRVENDRISLFGRQAGRRTGLVTAGITVALAVTGTAVASTQQFGFEQVGQTTANGLTLADDQHIDPIGSSLVINTGKIMSSTVSQDGTHMAAAVTDSYGVSLVMVDLGNNKVQQYIGTHSGVDLKISGNDIGQEGPVYSPDGKQLWLSRANGFTKFTVNADGSVADPQDVTIPADGSKQALTGAAVFSADGSTLFAAVNGQNRVVAIDTATGTVKRSWTTGTAPRGMVQVGSKLYVSNEGGRPAKPGETTMNSYGTDVPADPDTGAATTGTVSVIDLAQPSAAVGTINVGLHPTAVYAKNGTVFVTNTASNEVSVIDTKKDKVVQTIATQPWPEASVGYEPDAVTLTDDGHLLVTLGRANAVAVYRYKSAQQPASYVGLLPTGYFPAEVTTVGKNVVVSNTRGIDARSPVNYPPPAWYHGTHDTTSSVETFQLPDDKTIRADTAEVFKLNGWTKGSVKIAGGQGHSNKKPVPVPVQIGDPSTIKHVFLIVKENVTYDQIFGDMQQGGPGGDPRLEVYNDNVTPNQHALAQQFGLYNNFYDPATNSAEGHNWLMQSDDPEYTESSAGEYTRSYDTENDVLGHQSSGFIWSGAQAAGKSVKDFGEFQSSETKPAGASWQNLYCDTKNMRATGAQTAYPIKVGSDIPSLNKVSVQGFPQFDTSVPDIYKEQIWQQDFEKNGPANLNMFWLSNDHTGGSTTAPAQVADNDLAVGRMVDEISHSKYWKDSAIFVVEDDSQQWVDHVDGHRAPVQVISPWTQRTGTVDSHYYTQINMVRTIEQILGIHPMNQMDAAATPMTQAFTSTPDDTPFTAKPNRTSLTLGLSTPPSCGEDTPAPQDPTAAPAPTTAKAPAAEQQVAAQWQAWKAQQPFTGPNAKPDTAAPEQMKRLEWYESYGWTKPYPGDPEIYAPGQVPGAAIPGLDTDG